MVLGLCVQVLQEFFMCWKGLILLQVMHDAQGGAQALYLLRPLGAADPLPPGMNPLSVKDVVRRQEEPRCQEFEETLKFLMVVPQQDRRLSFRELQQVPPQFLLSHQVLLEGCSVTGASASQVLRQCRRCTPRQVLVL